MLSLLGGGSHSQRDSPAGAKALKLADGVHHIAAYISKRLAFILSLIADSHWSCFMQYTSRAAQLYKQQLEKDVAKFDAAAYLSTLKGKPTEPANVTAAVTATDKELVATNGTARTRPPSQNGSSGNLAALDDSSVEGAPASSTASVSSAQGNQQAPAQACLHVHAQVHLRLYIAG